MTILGFEITRKKAHTFGLTSVYDGRGGWWPIVREGFTGAWQRGIQLRPENVLCFAAVYRCVTLIASDIGKLRPMLVVWRPDGTWEETDSPAFSPLLRKPNRYQTRIEFFEQWIASKYIHGNTYALKQRDDRGVVTALYVLDPLRCRPLVAPDGSVYYSLGGDNLAPLTEASVIVPASEILHDKLTPLYHPLCGVSPISACGLAALQGLSIQEQSNDLFSNGARPGGILTTPGTINEEAAAKLQQDWQANFTGQNAGMVAVLGNGLKYEPMAMKAVDAQLIEQLKMSAEMVCTAFGVPAYMIGVGPAPAYNNIESLSVQYYTQTLQNPIEKIEALLDEGVLNGAAQERTGWKYATRFDLDELLRMDTSTQVKSLAEGVRGGLIAPNEGRLKLNYRPVKGGDTPYLQHQDWPLSTLAERSVADLQPAQPKADPAPESQSGDAEDEPVTDERAMDFWRKAFAA